MFNGMVEEGTKMRSEKHNQNRDNPFSNKDIHWTRAGSAKGPAQAKNNSSNKISGYSFFLWLYNYFFPMNRFIVPFLNKIDQDYTYSNCRSNDTVHVKRL